MRIWDWTGTVHVFVDRNISLLKITHVDHTYGHSLHRRTVNKAKYETSRSRVPTTDSKRRCRTWSSSDGYSVTQSRICLCNMNFRPHPTELGKSLSRNWATTCLLHMYYNMVLRNSSQSIYACNYQPLIPLAPSKQKFRQPLYPF